MKRKSQRYARAFTAASLLLGAGGEALAQDPVEVTENYCIPEGGMKEGGFEATDDVLNGGTLSLNGNAAIVDAPGMPFDGALQLTKAINGQVANVYYKDALDFEYVNIPARTTRAFRTFYSFSIGPNPTGSAINQGAGLTFLAHNAANGPYQVGANGSAMGYGGIGTSWAVQVDTFRDIPPGGQMPFSDPIGDHLGFMVDGDLINHRALHSPKDMNGDPIVFGGAGYKRYFVWLDYPGNGSRKMSVYLSDEKKKPDTPITWMELPAPNPLPMGKIADDYPVPSSFDPAYWMSVGAAMLAAQAWVGFSAANYSNGKNAHYIHEWEFSNVSIPCACQGATACKEAPETPACSAGKDTQNTGMCVECTTADTTGCEPAKPACHPTNEVCVECNVNPDCTKPSLPVCDPGEHECVECLASSDCPESKPVCDPASKTCGPCTTDAGCAGNLEKPACALTGMNSGTCVECTENSGCAAPTPVCDTAENACVECATDADCPSDKPECNPFSHVCGAGCTTGADCAGTPETPACAVSGVNEGNCVPCNKDADCPADKPNCDELTNICKPGCMSDADCGEANSGKVCDLDVQKCVDGCHDPGNRCPNGQECLLPGAEISVCIDCGNPECSPPSSGYASFYDCSYSGGPEEAPAAISAGIIALIGLLRRRRRSRHPPNPC